MSIDNKAVPNEEFAQMLEDFANNPTKTASGAPKFCPIRPETLRDAARRIRWIEVLEDKLRDSDIPIPPQ